MNFSVPIRILVVEGNLVVRGNMERMLSKMTYDLVDFAADYESAVAILESKNIHLVLIDIVLSTFKTGIELGDFIRKNHHIPFIFITSNSDRATVSKAKKVHPNGYIVKPFESKDLFTAIEIALFNFQYEKPRKLLNTSKVKIKSYPNNILTDSIFIKKQYIFYRISFHDIYYIKVDNVYLEVFTSDNTFLVRSTLKNYLAKLPSDIFFRAHKSYVVNINHIQAINVKDIVISKRNIPISKDFKNFLIRAMNS